MDAVIFDVDGTLWDSTEQVAEAWNEAIRDHSDLPADLTGERLIGEFGKPLPAIMDSLFPQLSQKEKDELADHMYKYENRRVESAPCVVYEKVPEVIRSLSKTYRLCIVSNCQSGYIEAFLKNTGLGSYITDFTCPGDTGKLKGENIRTIVERNQFRDAVYVGDTQGDATACKEAGIPMIYAAYGFGDTEEYCAKIDTFAELPDVLADLADGK